jgi:hypothetical protein
MWSEQKWIVTASAVLLFPLWLNAQEPQKPPKPSDGAWGSQRQPQPRRTHFLQERSFTSTATIYCSPGWRSSSAPARNRL